MPYEHELVYKEYIQREDGIPRAPYEPELEFYAAIRSGDIDRVREHCLTPFSAKSGLGKLSGDALRNLKYHLVITAALIARTCIDGGLDHTDAFALSDFYIQKIDLCSAREEIDAIHPLLCQAYAKKMRQLRTEKIRSAHIAACTVFIYEHLHTRITVKELAAHTGLHPNYLSRLFRKETGLTINSYIRKQKLEAARNMLMYSDYGSAMIASILAFPSQSYFSGIFRKETGMTPGAYRARFFRKTEIGLPSDDALSREEKS